MANTAWEVWKARCKCVFDDINPNPVEVIKLIQTLNTSIGKHMQVQHVSVTNNVQEKITRWLPPPSPYSFYCDASFKIINSVCYSGWGLICRSFAGDFIQAGWNYANGLVNAEAEEWRGLIHAMQHIQFTYFEMDTKLVINAVNGEIQHVAWENHTMIQDIKHNLALHPTWICKCINRRINKPAERVEKHARVHSISQTWNAYPPSFIVSTILKDMTYCFLYF